MALSSAQKQQVSRALLDSESAEFRAIVNDVGPEGPALQILVDHLKTLQNVDISSLAVAFRLDVLANTFITNWCTTPACPVRGRLVVVNSEDSAQPSTVSPLDADAAVIERLNIAEIFPARLHALRSAWITMAAYQFPSMLPSDLQAEADTLEYRVELNNFVGLMIKGTCPGKKCPGKSDIGEGPTG